MGAGLIDYPSVDALMAGPLGGWLDEQVAVREQAKRKAWGRLKLSALVLAPLIGLLWALAPLGWDHKVMIAAFAAFAAWGWSERPKRAAVKAVKSGINEALAGALGLTYLHDCEAGRAFELARAFKLLPSSDRESFEDLWEGTAGRHPFLLHEAHLEERRGSGKNRRWVTVFRGAIIAIGFERPFHGTTVLAREGRHDGWFSGPKDRIELGGLSLQHADMVHPDFADVFDVYTSDQTEARWLVHPEYIERLIALEQAYGGQDVTALFTGGELVIAIKSGNMFESGSIDPTEDRAKLERTIEQFRTLADLALALNRIDQARR
jgi:hypothetical protein